MILSFRCLFPTRMHLTAKFYLFVQMLMVCFRNIQSNWPVQTTDMVLLVANATAYRRSQGSASLLLLFSYRIEASAIAAAFSAAASLALYSMIHELALKRVSFRRWGGGKQTGFVLILVSLSGSVVKSLVYMQLV